jgi:hypothetical protein
MPATPTIVLVHGAFADADAGAWRTTPAWGIVSSADHTINPSRRRMRTRPRS